VYIEPAEIQETERTDLIYENSESVLSEATPSQAVLSAAAASNLHIPARASPRNRASRVRKMAEDRWNQIAAQICDERDPKRFADLVDELNSLIAETLPDNSTVDRATPNGPRFRADPENLKKDYEAAQACLLDAGLVINDESVNLTNACETRRAV
jgi:hypothetical protein